MGIHIARPLASLSLWIRKYMFISLSYRQLYSSNSGHALTCNCAKKHCCIIFCIKFTTYINNFLKKNSYNNLFFNFLLYDTLTDKLYGNALAKKNAIFFQLEIFVDKTTFNFHSFNKVNDFVTTQYTSAIFYRNP